MKEKTITITVLGIVTIVAIVALVLLLSSAKTGMTSIYGEERFLGSGWEVGHGTDDPITTAGAGAYGPGTGRAYYRIPFMVSTACIPTTEDGTLLVDTDGNPILGTLQTKRDPNSLTTIEARSCELENFAVSQDAQYTQEDLEGKMCCVFGGTTHIPSAQPSTGVAYYYSYNK